MGVYDRDYYKGDARGSRGFGGGFGGGGFGGGGRRLLELLNASFPIGTYLGITVRVHITFLLLVLFYLGPALFGDGDPMMVLRRIVLLFMSVLLHEFGHCLGCRAVGGQADNILMWPLGGLAYCIPPRRPWAEFVTVACGPLVNVVLAGVSWLVLWAAFGYRVGFNPFDPTLAGPLGEIPAVALFLISLFIVNYWLLLFNLALVFYPFDGGRLVQIALWTKMGYVPSLRLACRVGMVGAGIVALVGLYASSFLLIIIAIFGFMTCYRQGQMLRYAPEDEYGLGLDADYSAAHSPDTRRPGALSRWKAARAERRRLHEARQRREREQKVDAILDKIHREGIGSLSAAEKRILADSSRDTPR